MHAQRNDWREEPRGIALSSILLLLVHVAAVLAILYLAAYQPWESSGSGPEPVAEIQGAAGEGAEVAAAVPVDPAQPQPTAVP